MANTELIQREMRLYQEDHAAASAIYKLADEEKRSPTAEEDERFDKLIESAEKHKQRADKLDEQDGEYAELAEKVRNRIGVVTEPDSGVAAPTANGNRIIDEVRARIADVKNDRDRQPEREWDIPIDMDEVRAITGTSTTALFTSDFSTQVTVYARTLSPWLELATVITADNGRPIILPNLTVDPTTYTPGQGTAITESTPTTGTVTATPLGYKALSYVSAEAEEDEVVGLMGLIARAQGRSIGLAFGSAATTAILAAATNGGTATGVGGNGTAVSTFIGYEDLIDLEYSAAVPYRRAGVWVMANGAIKKVRKFKDQDGQYLWQPAIRAGEPPTFDGYAVYEDPNLAAPASATKSVIFGDASLWVVKQRPLRVAVSTDFKFDTDQVAIKSVLRIGGALPDALALRYLVSADT